MTSRWPEKSPWEKLSLATFIPARIICSITSGNREAGPMVQTNFVLWVGQATFRALFGIFGRAAKCVTPVSIAIGLRV